MTTSVNELCNPSRYSDQEWLEIHRNLESYSVDKHVFWHTNGGQIYRKGWEWTQCIYALQQLGVVHPSAAALGVGAGREPLIFYFADRVKSVTALDLYGNELWSQHGGRESDSSVTIFPERACPKQMDFSRVRFVNGSGTDLRFESERFDFCWSMSSIEHFGGHGAAGEAMREMARVTKPGGCVAIATEYLLLPEYSHPEYFTQEEIRRWILDASQELELVSEVDWNLPPSEYLVDSIVVPSGVDRRRRHVVLNDGHVQWTSIMLIFRKRQS